MDRQGSCMVECTAYTHHVIHGMYQPDPKDFTPLETMQEQGQLWDRRLLLHMSQQLVGQAREIITSCCNQHLPHLLLAPAGQDTRSV